jgi:hypothetical protein
MPPDRSKHYRKSLGQTLAFGLNALLSLISILLVTGITVRLVILLHAP